MYKNIKRKKVYTVMGSAGEYSDRTEWAICSFFDEEKAQERVTKATEKINEMIVYHRNNFEYDFDGWEKTKKQIKNKYDPHGVNISLMEYCSVDDVRYYYLTTDIIDS